MLQIYVFGNAAIDNILQKAKKDSSACHEHQNRFHHNIYLLVQDCCSIAQDLPSTASLLYPGIDGKLAYVADSPGNKIPDFSNAGYKGGGVTIPFVPVKASVWPVAGDHSASIQAAIDNVSALAPDASGFRGAVLLKPGTYPIEKPIVIRTSGVVLRGEGMSDIGTVLIGKTTKENFQAAPGRNIRPALITVSGSSGSITQEASKQSITNPYVPVGANSFTLLLRSCIKWVIRSWCAEMEVKIGSKNWGRIQ